ncbi:putative EMP1-like protein, partial [Plasmodium gaboni]
KEIDCMKDDKNGERTFYLVGTPQFLRWLEEWTQQFCEKYNSYFGDIETNCTGSSTSIDCGGDDLCKKACTKYNDWITSKRKEWDGMKNYYAKILRIGKSSNQSPDGTDYHAISQRTAIDYLNQKCKTAINGTDKCCFCQNIGKDSMSSPTPQNSSNNDKTLDHIDSVMLKRDEKYKNYKSPCTVCYIQHIKDQIKAIETILDKKRSKEDEEAKRQYGFSCENSGKHVNDAKLCEKLDYSGKDELAHKLKVPFNPDEKDPKKNKENDTINCGGIPSDKKDIIWVGIDHYNWLPNLDKNIYVSPRRQKLCYYGLDGSKNNHELKYKLSRAAANEGYNLGIKYNDYKNHYGVEPCKALEYSFYDYKHIIMGTDNLEEENNGTNTSIKESLKNYNASNGKSPDDKENRKKFWDDNKDCLWRIMKCGYKKAKEKSGDQTNHISDCGNTPTTFDDTPQFLVWFTEWSEDYCSKQRTQKNKLESACKNYMCNDSNNFTYKTKCKNACNEYKQFIQEYQKQYMNQKTKFDNEKKKKSGYDGLQNKDAYEFFKIKCSNKKCNCIYEDVKSKTEDGIKNFQEYPPGFKEKCECSIEECAGLSVTDSSFPDGAAFGGGYPRSICPTRQGNGNNCPAKETCINYNNKINVCTSKTYRNNDSWYKMDIKENNTNNNNKNIHNNNNDNEFLVVPPRTKQICLQHLTRNMSRIKNEEEFKEHILILASSEAKMLSELYSTELDKAFQAIKYSFADIGNIIKGDDILGK